MPPDLKEQVFADYRGFGTNAILGDLRRYQPNPGKSEVIRLWIEGLTGEIPDDHGVWADTQKREVIITCPHQTVCDDFCKRYVLPDLIGEGTLDAHWGVTSLAVGDVAEALKREQMPYEDYLRTPYWYAMRSLVRKLRLGRCERCGGEKDLQVHHRSYDRRGHETHEDLELLCDRCHKGHHAARRERNRRQAGINTYMSKRFGDDWNYEYDWDEAEEFFDEWLESKGEW